MKFIIKKYKFIKMEGINIGENNDKKDIESINQILSKEKIKELNNKIALLVKGIKEEREKNKNILKEIEILKYDKIVKEEQISKLKSENESLNLFLSKNDPKSYFENITKINTNSINFNPEEFNILKEENIKIKKENNTLIEQNSILKNKIEKLSEEYNIKDKNYIEEITNLKKERIELSNEIIEKQNKIEFLNNLYKDIEIQKNRKEGDLIKYQENEKNNKKIEENLVEKIKNLENANEKLNQFIIKLKNMIDNSILDIDKYIFKGFITEDDFNEKELYNKEINLKFNSKDTKIKLKIDTKIAEVDAKKIIFRFYNNAKNRVMITYVNKEGEKNVMKCEFSEKECEYIFKFKKEIMDNYEKIKDKQEIKPGGFLFNFFNDN
jgi:hypothetical protein